MEDKSIMNSNTRKKRNIKIILIVCCVLVIVVAAVIIISSRGKASTPKEYMIKTENYFDYQPYLECSGYSSAYVLRSLGVDISGKELYKNIPNKNIDGTVPIPSLTDYLLSEGYQVDVLDGSIDQLKEELCKGTPVIAFVKTAPNESYLHYLPIIGYDENTIYAVDSLKYKTNADNDYYNRTIKNEDFLKMWDNGVWKSNVYITIKLK